MEMVAFWAAAGGMGAAVAALFVLAMARARADIAAAADFDLKVYRDQLAEIDRDLARGTLPADEAERLRTEVSRRLLDADRAARTANRSAGKGGIAIAAALVLATIGGAYWTYTRLGAPGYPDLPLATRFAMSDEMRASRPPQAEMEATAQRPAPAQPDAQFADLMAKLRQAVADRPDDPRGLELLAANEARLGNLPEARAAMENLLRVKGDTATADDHAALAELMVMAAGGRVSPEAEEHLTRALTLDGTNPTARYYYGLMAAQVGRFDRTFALWRPLLDDGPADAPWIAPIRAQIEDVAMRAGIPFTLPPAAGLSGPDADAMAAASDMSPEDRQAMIEGMVAQLGQRLATEGGEVEEWARLISSLAVLDRKDEAQEIYAEALAKFEGSPSQQSFLREAALNAGLTP
ncbi:c-type cytochrome biogenesis protein CcmI [Rhodobacteraceae bacterium HSP-20]|uniref:C-type cytochrome biogenesis protein CcmI n=1 Tax=Paragemmobacter amnigenus TaxID=2852097 RepID=A0ABS6J7H5_9RHOB|nr:c-type cytochrome biogenesis protein CcmI [Rhodobacter amnigenus]MBU9699512.1 c-type cytochrome biogenesis protein CcmI [Rhodobacter amnigenus]MBV4390739.1 c-type cytochrome biogenesis protein CcmI [Rhodobacter amnigenus]